MASSTTPRAFCSAGIKEMGKHRIGVDRADRPIAHGDHSRQSPCRLNRLQPPSVSSRAFPRVWRKAPDLPHSDLAAKDACPTSTEQFPQQSRPRALSSSLPSPQTNTMSWRCTNCWANSGMTIRPCLPRGQPENSSTTALGPMPHLGSEVAPRNALGQQ